MTVTNTRADERLLVLITGANTGLGFETCRALSGGTTPCHILVGCRGSASRATEAINKLQQEFPDSACTAEPLLIDVSSDESMLEASRYVESTFGRLDVLVNNAGADFDLAMLSGRLSQRDGWNQSWDTNVTGTHACTQAFAPLLISSWSKTKQPRLIFITSGLSSLANHAGGTSSRYVLEPPGWPKKDALFLPYRASKTGLNMVAVEWARMLRNDGVHVFNLSPGFLDTGLSNDRATGEIRNKAALGAQDPALGGQFCAHVVVGNKDKLAWPARVLHRGDTTQPW